MSRLSLRFIQVRVSVSSITVVSLRCDLAYAPNAYNATAAYHQIKMEDIMQNFNEINKMLESVESKMAAAASYVSQSQFLPAIADILSKMERMVLVSSQMSLMSMSESGYDSCTSQDDASSVSTSTVPTSSPMPSSIPKPKGDSYIDKIKSVLCRLAPAGVYDATKAAKKRKKKAARRAERIIPDEFATLWSSLQRKEDDVLQQSLPPPPCPYPKVDWSKVNERMLTNLPKPRSFPVLACSPDPAFYAPVPGDHCSWSDPFYRENPHGTLPGYSTNHGIIAPPDHLKAHGYVNVQGGWLLEATMGGEDKADVIRTKRPPPRSRISRFRPPERRRRRG